MSPETDETDELDALLLVVDEIETTIFWITELLAFEECICTELWEDEDQALLELLADGN